MDHSSEIPGRAFYAPQTQLVDVSFREANSDALGQDPVSRNLVNLDIISTRVTQVHHGVSQVQLTLNNQRHRDGRPVHPPWKYNQMSIIRFGQRLRVDFRYGKDSWTPMLLARVTDMKFTFPSGGGAQVQVRGEDLLSLLKKKPRRDKRYRNKQEIEMVRDALERAGVQSDLALADAQRPDFTDSLRSMTHQKGQTYLQFLQNLGEPLDYEIFADFEDKPNPIKSRLHFEPARSLALGQIVDLVWGENLIEFSPTLKGWDQYTGAIAKGRHARRRADINIPVGVASIAPDLHGEAGGPIPIDAIQARRRFFADDTGDDQESDDDDDNLHDVSVSNLDEARARLKAEYELRQRARQFLTADASTIGFPSLRPGIHVNIKGVFAPFDGLYYVTQAVHTLDSSGYKTQVSLRRPGMLSPDLYPS